LCHLNLKNFMKIIIKNYLKSWWQPLILTLCLIVLTELASWLLDPPFIWISTIILFISILMILVSSIYQLWRRKWASGILSMAFFLGTTIGAVIVLGIISFCPKIYDGFEDLEKYKSVKLPIDEKTFLGIETFCLDIGSDVAKQLIAKEITVKLSEISINKAIDKKTLKVSYLVGKDNFTWWIIEFQIFPEGLLLYPTADYIVRAFSEDVKLAFDNTLEKLFDKDGKPREATPKISSAGIDQLFHTKLLQLADIHSQYVASKISSILFPVPTAIEVRPQSCEYTKRYISEMIPGDYDYTQQYTSDRVVVFDAFVRYKIGGLLKISNVTFHPCCWIDFYYKEKIIDIHFIGGETACYYDEGITEDNAREYDAGKLVRAAFSSIFRDGIKEVIEKSKDIGLPIGALQRKMEGAGWKACGTKLSNKPFKLILWQSCGYSFLQKFSYAVEIISKDNKKQVFQLPSFTDTFDDMFIEVFSGNYDDGEYLHFKYKDGDAYIDPDKLVFLVKKPQQPEVRIGIFKDRNFISE